MHPGTVGHDELSADPARQGRIGRARAPARRRRSRLPRFGEADVAAVVHQAAGMVSQQCGCGIADALALLRARAFSAGRRHPRKQVQ
jgi:hypothetical protein